MSISIRDAINSLKEKQKEQATKSNVFKFSTISDAVFTTALYRGGIELEEIDRLLTEPKQNRDKILESMNL